MNEFLHREIASPNTKSCILECKDARLKHEDLDGICWSIVKKSGQQGHTCGPISQLSTFFYYSCTCNVL